MSPSEQPNKIAVIGLGYVGLPLAIALARHYTVVGFDISERRVASLRAGHDWTHEVADADVATTTCRLESTAKAMAGSDVFIVAVPTPVDDNRKPDFGPVIGACEAVGPLLKPGNIVCFESTVYPGATEEICAPILERKSGLKCGKDFWLGYSPERMNPGDPLHTLANIVKVVAGQTPEVGKVLAEVYGKVTRAGVFLARDIATAEAAKVIENAQRDINIAFINEVTQIFNRLGLSIYDVLDAANTKWNFLNFRPGLVGGHCIGVDPYYLADRALQIGYHPTVVLAGRQTNDGMGAWLAESIAKRLSKPSRVLVLGLTFKENVPDLRNSGVASVIARLKAAGHTVSVHDAYADAAEAKHEYGVDLLPSLDGAYDAVVGAVAHKPYVEFDVARLRKLLPGGGLVADIKGFWRDLWFPAEIRVWRP
ncbi:MAG: nucleotide sugar dehydrogenase [Alphaproteobacteria bacterium]|nr:nucleotide sugar dehydrogenase [Alphaproteobacteria bacterium]